MRALPRQAARPGAAARRLAQVCTLCPSLSIHLQNQYKKDASTMHAHHASATPRFIQNCDRQLNQGPPHVGWLRFVLCVQVYQFTHKANTKNVAGTMRAHHASATPSFIQNCDRQLNQGPPHVGWLRFVLCVQVYQSTHKTDTKSLAETMRAHHASATPRFIQNC